MIVVTYQVQNEVSAVSDRLSHLQDKICEDALTVINRCESHDELDFIFPEIIRIKNHDLAVLDSWQNHVDWIGSLPSSELKLLSSADFNNQDTHYSAINLAEPPEQLVYQSLTEKSHFYSLRDQLLFIFEPELRQQYEFYISKQAVISGYKTLVISNLQQASDLTVANLYHYFNIRDESEDTPEIPSNLSFIGYEKLQELLAAGKWKEANEETRITMLKVAGRTKQGYFEVENIKNFPSHDLYIIDQLWVIYTKGNFGFSIQKGIWQNVQEDWHEFGIRVKWGKLDKWQIFKWISKDDLTFNLKVSQGHLPAIFPCITQSTGFSANLVWSLLSRQDL